MKTLKQFTITAVVFAFAASVMAATEGYDALPTSTPPAEDRHPDYVLQNANTHQTAFWYLNNNLYIGSAYGPTLPAGWELKSVADFNWWGSSGGDYVLFAPNSRQTAIWYMSGPTFMGGAYGPTIRSGWELVAAANFFPGDGLPD